VNAKNKINAVQLCISHFYVSSAISAIYRKHKLCHTVAPIRAANRKKVKISSSEMGADGKIFNKKTIRSILVLFRRKKRTSNMDYSNFCAVYFLQNKSSFQNCNASLAILQNSCRSKYPKFNVHIL
jgi:hypothetical protein